MSVKAKFSLDNPDEMMATMTFTMSVGDWKKISAGLASWKYPVGDVIRAINQLVCKAEAGFGYAAPKEGE